MKKIAIASAAMGGVALIAFGAGGTFAAFSDTAETSGEVGAGTLVLSTTEEISTQARNLELAPGQSTLLAFPVQNGGNLPGVLTAVAAIQDAPDACDSASEAGSCGGLEGDFSRLATVSAYQRPVNSAVDCTPTVNLTSATLLAGDVPLAALDGERVTGQRLSAGQVTCFVLRVSLDQNVGNEVQGDSATLTVDLTLDQATSAPSTPGNNGGANNGGGNNGGGNNGGANNGGANNGGGNNGGGGGRPTPRV
ncbi:TasA family protein [Trujillonella humicola]|uniref:TasA family protein n=1 Tax=Trujillonella humicola TaxID=3383699 RepID=UPI003905E45B